MVLAEAVTSIAALGRGSGWCRARVNRSMDFLAINIGVIVAALVSGAG